MLENIRPDEVLFLDIETVPQQSSFENLDESFQHLWNKKSAFFRKPEETAAEVYARAGIYAEFGKIVCISTGYMHIINGEYGFRIKSFFGHDEHKLLYDFAEMLSTYTSKRNIFLCAHNGKEFDFPYIARRMLINSINLPKALDIAGKKPWETTFIDTLELWKFGDYKSYTSLELLTKIFGIPTPKDDIDGSMVAHVYWQEQNIDRIAVYCEKDVVAIAQLFLRYRNEPLIKEANIQSITSFQHT
ncbi:MAG: 3'-5' exonuclease [Bacteroidota bacterium]|nr:3'-5' exonuclease [Bacteroidota bacterium]